MFYPSVRQVFEDHCRPQDSHEQRMVGAARFVDRFRSGLGLSYNPSGRPVVAESAAFSPREFSFKGLAECLCGYEWVERLNHANQSAFQVFEAGGAGMAAITPGNIPNVSAFLASVTGLLDASLLHGYDLPEYVIDQLIPTEPSKTRQKKMIGLGRIGDLAGRRMPGDPHPFAQFRDRYIVTQETQQDALAMAVTFESVFFDQTGEVLDQANKIGQELGLRKELDGFRLIAGVINPYNYNGVAYNTYVASGGNWVNTITNALLDWTDLNILNASFSRMTDQETGNRIGVNWDTLLCSPTKMETAKYIQNATEIETRTASSTEIRRGRYLGETKKLVSSVYLDQVLTAAVANQGLALSQSDADEYWWALKTTPNQSAFVRHENWPFTVNRASPNDYDMLNHKLLLAVFANQMHSFDVREPRYTHQNTPS